MLRIKIVSVPNSCQQDSKVLSKLVWTDVKYGNALDVRYGFLMFINFPKMLTETYCSFGVFDFPELWLAAFEDLYTYEGFLFQ